jgi:hypothetical protein
METPIWPKRVQVEYREARGAIRGTRVLGVIGYNEIGSSSLLRSVDLFPQHRVPLLFLFFFKL